MKGIYLFLFVYENNNRSVKFSNYFDFTVAMATKMTTKIG